MMLNAEQQIALDMVLEGSNIFITGPGGVGKSTLVKEITTELLKIDKKVGVTAMTGSAAILLKGSTLHSFLKIGLGRDDPKDIIRKLRKNGNHRWLDLDVLIIDEVSMLDPELFDKLEYIARILRKSTKPFGGIQLVLSGDFYQLPCVASDKFCFESTTWDKCITNTIYLTTIIRQEDREFQECLNKARIGELTEEDCDYLKEASVNVDKNAIIKPTKILCYNKDVDDINDKKLMCLPETELHCYEMDIESNPDCNWPFAIVSSKYCSAKETLNLSKGAQVMLLYNKDVTHGLVNGSRGVVTDFEDGLPVVTFYNGIITTIDYHEWEAKEGSEVIGSIFQIPLKLAYAITVHKSQGLTLDRAYINLEGVFEYGQAYVALSRIRTIKGLTIRGFGIHSFKANPKAVEYYKTLLKMS